MINQFTQYIADHHLFDSSGRILLAVSGGMDSMVMWHLFDQARYDYAVLHCNFQLRGEASDGDEQLVTQMAGDLGVKIYTRRFETREYAALKGISIEMAARELRYEWFEEIRMVNHYDCIATAHHLDDLLETFFINLIRKTGLKGLTGFRPVNGRLVRPMLFASRSDIEKYAKEYNIPFRYDQTNSDIAIQRNFIRHKTIPDLVTVHPAFRENLAQTIIHLRSVEEFFLTEVDRQLHRIALHEYDGPAIRISALLKLPHPKLVLYEWLSRYGFNSTVADQLFNALDANPGRQFLSGSHRAIIDRDAILMTHQLSSEDGVYYVEKEDLELFTPLHLSLRMVGREGLTIDPNPRKAFIDAEKLIFPLTLRRWRQGSYFQPLGMDGLKKISDFFTDQKLSIPEKENIWILYSQEQVVWIVGHRIDHRFRITTATRQVLCISMEG